MRTPIFHIDAFTTRPFAGNPAAVMLMDRFPEDTVLQEIAAENNLSETAFLVPEGGDYRLRWFTPTTEVPLCGHATLASAAVVMERLEPGRGTVVFHSASGPLTVNRTETGYVLDFPIRTSEQISTPPALAEALRIDPIEVFTNEFNYLALLGSGQVLRALAPDMAALAHLDRPGVIVTRAWGRNLRLRQPLLRAIQGHPGRSGDRRCALHVGTLLGQAPGQDYVSRFPGLAAWRRDRLSPGGRSRQAGRRLRFLSGGPS